jgi:hypothetical protein
MPKAEKGTPKDIANRMKAKGLQKVRYYLVVWLFFSLVTLDKHNS